MKHVRSTAPYDITQWEDMPSPTPRATYPQSMRMADGSIYLFYRAGGHPAPWSLRISKDDGESWSKPEPIIEMRRDFPDKKACSYNAFVPGADYKTVHCFWVYKDDDPRRNKRKYQGMHEAVYRYNFYYAKRSAEGQWVSADGSPMSDLPVNKTFADRHAMFLDSGEEFTAPTRIVIDEDDTPYIHIRQGVTDWKRGKVFVPFHYRFGSPSNGNWRVHDEMRNQWPELVKDLLLSAGPAVFGGRQPNEWFIHYKEGPPEDPKATYVWLGHIEKGYAIRQDGLDYPVARPPAGASGITRPGAASDANKGAKRDGADQPAAAPESPAAESAQYLGAANGFEKETVIALADRVRAHVNSQPLRFPNQHWVRGAYYAGLLAMYESTSDRAYLDDCMGWGKQVSWGIKEQGGGPYESGAFPLVCGQIWYGCYRAKKDELMMQPTLAFLEDPKVENPLSAPGKWYLENTRHRFVDGLFTAPPTLAMLYQMTGDEKYVDWMNACFWDVHKEIFDHDAGLFYRDARSKPRKTKNGKKVLWSRGNGWAFGGLTRILKHLPERHASYARYKALYIQMAESLAKRQQADGFWRSNLDDPEQYTMKESSGTAVFCYGITWGINNGILDRERFLPVARRAWTALASVVNEDGKVGWSQPAGGGPGKVAEADTSKFGTGIFLLAASEIHLLIKNKGNRQYDVVVYGGTPGGITAAISAAREGASVVLLEQTRHVGGLTTSGLNRDECNHLDRQTLGGLCEQFIEEAVKRSNGRWTEGNYRTWQSGIAERVFLEMLEKAGVEVRYEQLLDQVGKDGTRITELRVQGGEIYRAKVFIDTTYEGDLMAKAGVSYSVGRESAEQYGESIAGVRYLDDKVAISPFDDNGTLLFGVMPGRPPVAGFASEVPICYNVRLNLTSDEANRGPIEKPSSYDPMQHELLARALEAGLLKDLKSIIGIYPLGDSSKRELNNRQFSIVSMSIPGAQTSWAEASFEEREAVHQKYRDYTHGMLWFLKTDPRVPERIRNEMAPYGFCKDEWVDNDHWPYYLYIRAARRMQGEIILTEADVIEDVDKEDVIHVGSHFIDCHHAARYVSDSGHIINEGRIWKVGTRFDIPCRAITPKAGECSNLLVPVCASASHVAFCTIRLEPTWMHLGEAAGIAAVTAGKSGKSVQAVDVKSLQARLLELGIPLEHPVGPMAYEKKRGKPRTFAPDDVLKEFFASADKNGDGMASRSEWNAARPTWEWLFGHMDKDKNGQLDRAEYKAWQTYKKEHPDWHKSLRKSLN